MWFVPYLLVLVVIRLSVGMVKICRHIWRNMTTVLSVFPKPPVQFFFFPMLWWRLCKINRTSESIQHTTVLHHSGIVVGQSKENFGVFAFQVVNGGYTYIPQVGCKRFPYSGYYRQFLNRLLFGHCVWRTTWQGCPHCQSSKKDCRLPRTHSRPNPWNSRCNRPKTLSAQASQWLPRAVRLPA